MTSPSPRVEAPSGSGAAISGSPDGPRQFDDGRAVGQLEPVSGGGAAVGSGDVARRSQHRAGNRRRDGGERALAAVRLGQQHEVVIGSHGSPALGDSLRDPGGIERPLEGIGGDHDAQRHPIRLTVVPSTRFERATSSSGGKRSIH